MGWRKSANAAGSPQGIAWGDGYFTFCANGSVRYQQSVPWGTFTSTALTGAWKGIAYGNGYWVVVGDAGKIGWCQGTPDGTWDNSITTSGAENLTSVAYGNGYWVAVGATGAVYYRASTPNGTWTANAQGASSWQAVTYGNGYWCTVGNAGAIRYRLTDPTGAWTLNTSGSSQFNDVEYGNGYWVLAIAGGNTAIKYRATDPTSTFTVNDPGGGGAAQTVAQGSSPIAPYGTDTDYWIAGGSAVNGMGHIAVTEDPTVALRLLPVSEVGGFGSSCYGNGFFIMEGTVAGNVWYTQEPEGDYNAAVGAGVVAAGWRS